MPGCTFFKINFKHALNKNVKTVDGEQQEEDAPREVPAGVQHEVPVSKNAYEEV